MNFSRYCVSQIPQIYRLLATLAIYQLVAAITSLGHICPEMQCEGFDFECIKNIILEQNALWTTSESIVGCFPIYLMKPSFLADFEYPSHFIRGKNKLDIRHSSIHTNSAMLI